MLVVRGWALVLLGSGCLVGNPEWDAPATGDAGQTGSTSDSPGATNDGTHMTGGNGDAPVGDEATGTPPPDTDSSGGLPPPADWWDPDWHARAEVTVDGDVAKFADFTVRVDLDTAELGLVDTDSIRFVQGAAELPYELEVPPLGSGGPLIAWLLYVPPPDATTPLYLYFDNPEASAPAGLGPWSDAYVGVYHLGDAEASSGHALESNGVVFGTEGIAGAAAELSASDAYLLTTDPGYDDLPLAGLTVSAWVQIDELPQIPGYVFDKRGMLADGGWYIGVFGDTQGLHYGFSRAREVQESSWSGTVGNVEDWHYISIAYADDTEDPTMVFDGAVVRPVETDGSGASSSDADVGFRIGSSPALPGAAIEGSIDEVRVAAIARGPQWMQLQYEAQAGDLTSVGPVELYPG